LRGRNGEYRWFLSRAFPIRDAEGKVLLWFGTNTDVTEQREAHELLERRVAERTEALRETIFQLESFSYSITHDMRGPLRAMTGFARVLEDDYGPALDPGARALLKRITNAAVRLDRLIQDVLTYSRLARGDMPLQSVDLPALIRDIVREYPNFKEHEQDIHMDCVEAPVRGNLAALTQCLSNLLDNAIKFVATGVRPRVRIWCEPRGTNVRLWIEDNGIGIAPEHQRQIFGVFKRLHPEGVYSGTGIGLAIVEKAMERMGGTVGVESERGKGSRFWFELPRAEENSAPSGQRG
jgi:signal transduction histidine kinase